MKIGRRNHEFYEFQVWPDYRSLLRRDPVDFEASNRYNVDSLYPKLHFGSNFVENG